MPSFDTRPSTLSGSRQPVRTTNGDKPLEKEQLWIPMLQSASKGKDLSEKHLLLLGGSPDQQRGFLEHLNPPDLRRDRRRGAKGGGAAGRDKTVPVSNKYALGYTYHDVLDADQEDVLARLNVHMLTNPSAKFAPFLKPLLKGQAVKDTLAVILLDWNDPFQWARQLRQWIRLLRKVIVSLDDETKIELEECMTAWKEKRVGPDATNLVQEANVVAKGPGEWDEELGIPLAVVCVQSEQIERLERDLGWEDDQFDFVQQWLRTVLLKHGASLAFTATFDANNVRSLIHTSLSIQSLLKKEVIKHNVIDRDKILVPPNWDSWGKIRILKEGFDPEVISEAWSIEIQEQPEDDPDLTLRKQDANNVEAILDASQRPASAVILFETSLPNPIEPASTASRTTTSTAAQITTVATPLQDFLQTQHTILEKYLAEDREANAKAAKTPGFLGNPLNTVDGNEKDVDPTISARSASPSKRMAESVVGPYQINVNGIDFDADEITKRIRDREAERVAAAAASSSSRRDRDRDRDRGDMTDSTGVSTPASSSNRPRLTTTTSTTEGPATPGAEGKEKPSNEALHGFFANLIKKGQGAGSAGSRAGLGSGANSPAPRRESPAPNTARKMED